MTATVTQSERIASVPEDPGQEWAGVSGPIHPVPSPGGAPGARRAGRHRLWLRRYVLSLGALDGAGFMLAALGARGLGYPKPELVVAGIRLPYVMAALGVAILWVAVLASAGAYDRRAVGSGPDEYRHLFNGAIRFLAVFALIEVALRTEVSRAVVVATVPAGLVLCLLIHHQGRRWLVRARSRGRYRERLILVGRERESVSFLRHLQLAGSAGLEVVGVFTGASGPWAVALPDGIEMIATRDQLFERLRSGAADSVAVVDTGALGGEGLRDLGWALEGLGVDVMVAPEATDVVGPRLAVRPVGGLPLLHVEEPRFTGAGRMVKDVVERTLAAVCLLLAAPVMGAIALAIKLASPGPVLFRQTRVGREGRNFTMFKFRSMRVDAERALAEVSHLNESDGLLFKVRRDPRITAVGRWMRRFSIDEIPQLYNVVRGDMSVVGPRPPLPSEVERYAAHVRRRLLVKPGITGLWQVNGRSDLSWEDSVRLDLHYVDNWSPTGDLVILLRTLGAVVRGRGAY